MSYSGRTVCPVCGRTTGDPSGMHWRCWLFENVEKVSTEQLEEEERQERVRARKRRSRRNARD